ncbi:carbon storage regulator CsrA [Clostridium sp. BJN0001]|uniref:carbon storage regulator CsrA n=1 Tax=Clostridium sp. BJN0001 TaxID=2930219 RepID=UPI001FD50811|nr:carbon storage regulator CsrA [Clostridium sp. BJN0001]
MLIITRKKGQSLKIGDDIEITVSRIDDGSVKLGINAPKEVSILRKEIYDEVQKENKDAVKVDLNMLKNISKK